MFYTDGRPLTRENTIAEPDRRGIIKIEVLFVLVLHSDVSAFVILAPSRSPTPGSPPLEKNLIEGAPNLSELWSVGCPCFSELWSRFSEFWSRLSELWSGFSKLCGRAVCV